MLNLISALSKYQLKSKIMAEKKIIPPAKKEELMFETLAVVATGLSFYFAYRRLQAKKKQL